MVDSGKYEESWEQAAQSFQRAISQEEWVARLEKVRRPLGKVISRKLCSLKIPRSLKDATVGTSLEYKLNTSFDGLLAAVETLTCSKQPDGSWRTSGYLIRPAERFSRTAIAGACLPFAVCAVGAVAAFCHALSTEAALCFSFVISGIGATILGIVAASQIRRSASRLGGMWLAVFDCLLFPLLVLNALVGYAASNEIMAIGDHAGLWAANSGYPPINGYTSIAVTVGVKIVLFLLLLGSMLAADAFIFRALARALNKPSRSSGSLATSVAVAIFVAALVLGGIGISVFIHPLTPPVKSLVAPAEPPKLRYLQWAEAVKPYSTWHAWEPFSGKFVSRKVTHLPDFVALKPGVTKNKGNPAPGNLAFLYLWFSHPDFDRGACEVTLLDDTGKPLDLPGDWNGTGESSAYSDTQNLGWITATVCVGCTERIPPWINVRLKYGIGPWMALT